MAPHGSAGKRRLRGPIGQVAISRGSRVKTLYKGLVGDIGGTNARLAMVDEDGHLRHPKTYATKDYGSLTEIVATYLETAMGRKRPERVVLAVAGPLVDGEIELTNIDWRISEGELVGAFEFEKVRLLNDFGAQALAAPHLPADSLRRIGPDLRPSPTCPIVVVGAGTGFGVAGLVHSDRGDLVLQAEGGHASFAPSDDVEIEIFRILKARFGRVSIERILSGAGMVDLYAALCELAGETPHLTTAQAITTSKDAQALATVARFCAILGSVAGDIALTYGARGGVYIAGGIAPQIQDPLMQGDFRARFEAKGRMSSYMADIPTTLITHPYAALVGAARALDQTSSDLL